MQNLIFKKFFHILKNLAKLKNYVFPNLMAIRGYFYAVTLHQLNIENAIVYSTPGADTTDAGIMHTFDCAIALANFMISSFFLAMLGIVEYFLRKKFFPDGFLKCKPPLFIEILHSIVFWIGMWFPLSRFACAVLFLILTPISEFLLRFS